MSLTSEDFVRALYLGVLGREADAEGLGHHVAALGENVAAANAADLVQRFIASDEFRQRRTPSDALDLLRPPPSGAPFVHVASLGSHCYVSTTLKSMALKRYSLPFDWIFSSLGMVAHCIEDDFSTFLDPAQYRSNPPETRPEPKFALCDHDFYRRDYGVEHVFNHFDPTGVAQHAYLIRAVSRFRRLLASPERKLFLAVVKTQQPAAVSAAFERLVQVLGEQTGNFRLEVLALLPSGGAGDFRHTVLQRRGANTLAVMQPLSLMDGIQFQDPFDELFVRRLIAQHSFALAPSV